KLLARVGHDQLALGQIVHPVVVGRDEDISRRAVLDLLGERRARAVGHLGAAAVLEQKETVRLIERILKTCGSEHHDVGELGLRWQAGGHKQYRHRRGPQDRTPDARGVKTVVGWIAAKAAYEDRHRMLRAPSKTGAKMIAQQLYTTTAFWELPARCPLS